MLAYYSSACHDAFDQNNQHVPFSSQNCIRLSIQQQADNFSYFFPAQEEMWPLLIMLLNEL